jgi:hypothetical protein
MAEALQCNTEALTLFGVWVRRSLAEGFSPDSTLLDTHRSGAFTENLR